MIKNSLKQTGSSFVVVIIILVIAIAAVLGFIFWNDIQDKPSSEKVTSSKSTTDNSKKDDEVKPRYLSISDWAVKFTLPTGLMLSDIYYYKTHVGEGPEYYGFTTNRVRAQGGACDNQVTGNLVTLTRSTAKDGNGTLINNTAIGGYFYYSGSSVGDIVPTPECLLTDIAVQDHASLDEMIKSLAVQ
jgi:hypothetical protein